MPDPGPKNQVRLQRFLAQTGITSRRKAEDLIVAGRVKVNGRVVRELGTSVDPQHDRVEFDGNRMVLEDHVWLLLNKPRGTVSTVSDPEGRETVLDLVGNQGVRLYPVGRLDYNTEGVLLLTNDGELAAALMHPRNQIQRVYHVKVKGLMAITRLDDLRNGVPLDGRMVAAKQVSVVASTGNNTWIEVVLGEGRNRQIHRMMEAIDCNVLKLVRVAYAGLTVEKVPPGHYRALTQGELNQLRTLVNLPGQTRRREATTPGRHTRKQAPRKTPARSRPNARSGGASSKTGARKPAPRPDQSKAPREGASSRTARDGARRAPVRKPAPRPDRSKAPRATSTRATSTPARRPGPRTTPKKK